MVDPSAGDVNIAGNRIFYGITGTCDIPTPCYVKKEDHAANYETWDGNGARFAVDGGIEFTFSGYAITTEHALKVECGGILSGLITVAA